MGAEGSLGCGGTQHEPSVRRSLGALGEGCLPEVLAQIPCWMEVKLPAAVSRGWSSFFLPLVSWMLTPQTSYTQASVVLVLELKQYWALAQAPIILCSGIWSWERPGLEVFLS